MSIPKTVFPPRKNRAAAHAAAHSFFSIAHSGVDDLAHVPQLQAQGINLISFLPTGLLATVIYAVKKQIVWKQVLLMWCGGAVAAAGGYLLAKFIETALLSKIFAVFLVTFGLYQLIFTGKNSQMNKNI